jgi:hypothetical protein
MTALCSCFFAKFPDRMGPPSSTWCLQSGGVRYFKSFGQKNGSGCFPWPAIMSSARVTQARPIQPARALHEGGGGRIHKQPCWLVVGCQPRPPEGGSFPGAESRLRLRAQVLLAEGRLHERLVVLHDAPAEGRRGELHRQAPPALRPAA